MDIEGIDASITSYLRQYVSDLNKKDAVEEKIFTPDFSVYDEIDEDKTQCVAFRVQFLGKKLNKNELEYYLAGLSSDLSNKSSVSIPDIDGDGKEDLMHQHNLSLSKIPTDAPGKPFCGQDWPLVSLKYQPFLYVIDFSGGGHVIVESMAFLIKAGNSVEKI